MSHPQQRLIYLDALRGFFILYIVWLHALLGVVFHNDPEAVKAMPQWLLLAFAPLALVSTWAPIFALISGTANAYVMHSTLLHTAQRERAHVGKKLLKRGLLNNALLYPLSLVNMALMHHTFQFDGTWRYTLLTSSAQEGRWMPFSPQLLFYNDALALIATAGICTTLLVYGIWRFNAYVVPKNAFQTVTAVCMAWLVASPILHHFLGPVYYHAVETGEYLQAAGLKMLVGPNQSPFPNVAFGYAGVLFGLALASNVSLQTLRFNARRAAAALVAGALILIAYQGFSLEELGSHTFPMKLHMINLALMTLLCTRLVAWMEYNTPERRARIARISVPFRRVGMAALSVFLLEALTSVLISKPYMAFWGGEEVFKTNPVAIISYLALLIAFWCMALKLWERYDFKYSFEWMIVQASGWLLDRRSNKLNAEIVLYGPTQVRKLHEPSPEPLQPANSGRVA